MEKRNANNKELISVLLKGFSGYPHINYQNNNFSLIPKVYFNEI